MDPSSVSGSLGNIADELLGDAAAKIGGTVGMSPAQIQPLIEKTTTLIGSSSLTPEIEASIAQLAIEHGVPTEMVDLAVSMIKTHLTAPAK